MDGDGSLSQAPFSYSGAPGGAIGSAWQVPVLHRQLDGPAATPTLLAGTPADPLGDPAGLVVNAGGSGYYRVAYPSDHLARLAGRLGDLAPLERYNLVSDTWASALAGQGPSADLFHLARALRDGDISAAARMLGRPPELDGVVVGGDRPSRGRDQRDVEGLAGLAMRDAKRRRAILEMCVAPLHQRDEREAELAHRADEVDAGLARLLHRLREGHRSGLVKAACVYPMSSETTEMIWAAKRLFRRPGRP